MIYIDITITAATHARHVLTKKSSKKEEKQIKKKESMEASNQKKTLDIIKQVMCFGWCRVQIPAKLRGNDLFQNVVKLNS